MADETKSSIIYSGTKVSQLSVYPGSVLSPDDLFLISKKDADGKYTSYKLDYRNMLTAVTTNSFLSNVYYDQTTQQLVLEFTVNENQLCSVSCTISDMIEPYADGTYIQIDSNNKINALMHSGRYTNVHKGTNDASCYVDCTLSSGRYTDFDDNKVNARITAGSGVWLSSVNNSCQINVNYGNISSVLNLSNYVLSLSDGYYIHIDGNKISALLRQGNGIKLQRTADNYCQINADLSSISSQLFLSTYAKQLSAGSYISISDDKINALMHSGRFTNVHKGADNASCYVDCTLSGGNYIDITNNKINAKMLAGSGITLNNVNNQCQINANYDAITSNISLSDYAMLSSLSAYSTQKLSAGTYTNINGNRINVQLTAGNGISLSSTNGNFCKITNALSSGDYIDITSNKINSRIVAGNGITVSKTDDNECLIDADYSIISSELNLSNIQNLSAGDYIKIDGNRISALVKAGNGINVSKTDDNECLIDADYSIISSELRLSDYSMPYYPGRAIKIAGNCISSMIFAGKGLKENNQYFNNEISACYLEADFNSISNELNLSALQNLSAGDYIQIDDNRISALVKAGDGISISKTDDNECLIEADISQLSSTLSINTILSSKLSGGTYTEVDYNTLKINSLLTAGDCISITKSGDKYAINANICSLTTEINLSDYAMLSDLEHIDVLSSQSGKYVTVNLNGKTYTIDANLSAISTDLDLSSYDTKYYAGTYMSVDASDNKIHNMLRQGRGILIQRSPNDEEEGIYKINTNISEISADLKLSDYVLIKNLNRLSAGLSCCPIGEYTWVEGFKTSAYGDFGHSEGLCTIAYGHGLRLNSSIMRSYLGNVLNFAHAEGSNTYAYSVGSHTEGDRTSAYAAFSHAEGLKCTVLSLDEGGQKYVAEYAHVEGRETSCAGRFSHAEGDCNYVKGYGAHVEGLSSVVYGNYAHAEGRSNVTYGDGSHVEGDGNINKGDYSHVEGQYNNVYGKTNNTNGHYSHAEGQENKVYGSYSHAEGKQNVICSDYSHAEGVSCTIPLSDDFTFCFNGVETSSYGTHGPGTFNINVIDGLNSIYIGQSTLYKLIKDVVKQYVISGE